MRSCALAKLCRARELEQASVGIEERHTFVQQTRFVVDAGFVRERAPISTNIVQDTNAQQRRRNRLELLANAFAVPAVRVEKLIFAQLR